MRVLGAADRTGTDLPLIAIVASAREFIVPVELYLLGRLAIAAGVDLWFMVKILLGSAAVAAAATVLLYFVPATFWNSTMDLVRFEREVQGSAMPSRSGISVCSGSSAWGSAGRSVARSARSRTRWARLTTSSCLS